MKKRIILFSSFFIFLAFIGYKIVFNRPEVLEVTHKKIEDINNYPTSKVYMGDSFSLNIKLKNNGFFPIKTSYLTITTNNIVKAEEENLLLSKSDRQWKEIYVMKLNNFKPKEESIISLNFSSMAGGNEFIKIDTQGILPKSSNKPYEYNIFFEYRKAVDKIPFVPNDIHSALQNRAYDECKKKFPCKLQEGICKEYPNSKESRDCVIKYIDIYFKGCEIHSYDRKQIEYQINCLNKKHGFKF